MSGEKMTNYRFEVSPEHRGVRLDLFLMSVLHEQGLSRSSIQRLVAEDLVRVNDQLQRSSYRLKGDELIEVTVPQFESVVPVAEEFALEILFEDSSIIVINKPAGISVHPGAGSQQGTLVNALLFHTRELSSVNGPLRPGIVHRLDKTTSGVMVVAKNDRCHVRLARQFQKRAVHKEYLAIVHGNIIPPVGQIDLPIGRNKQDRQKMAVVKTNGREAITHYSLEERFTFFDLLRLKPLHGRTHQLRVHLAHIGHPVLGDKLYGKNVPERARSDELSAALADLDGNALHAQRLSFNHPATGELISFETPLPRPFETICALLRKQVSKE